MDAGAVGADVPGWGAMVARLCWRWCCWPGETWREGLLPTEGDWLEWVLEGGGGGWDCG